MFSFGDMQAPKGFITPGLTHSQHKILFFFQMFSGQPWGSERRRHPWPAEHQSPKAWTRTCNFVLLKHFTSTAKGPLQWASQALLWNLFSGTSITGWWLQAFLFVRWSQRRVWRVLPVWICFGIFFFVGRLKFTFLLS